MKNLSLQEKRSILIDVLKDYVCSQWLEDAVNISARQLHTKELEQSLKHHETALKQLEL